MSALLDVRDLTVSYRMGKRWLPALRDFSLRLQPGEILGIVGESGSGKSTAALAILRYLAANARLDGGELRFDGIDLRGVSPAALRDLWARRIKLVPQNAGAALNPSMRIGAQVKEALYAAEGISGAAAHERVMQSFREVKLVDPARVMRRYPHELSGGMQQRVAIAMALLSSPDLLILDEPTTGLDVTTEAAILDLLRALIGEGGAGILYITHNLGVVAQLCQRVMVLYAGEIMETAPVAQLFAQPRHPYTRGLLDSLPKPGQRKAVSRLRAIPGNPPSLRQNGGGCAYAGRCPLVADICRSDTPPLESVAPGRLSRCFHWSEMESIPPPPNPLPHKWAGGFNSARPLGNLALTRETGPPSHGTSPQPGSPSPRVGAEKRGDDYVASSQPDSPSPLVGARGWGMGGNIPALQTRALTRHFPVPRSLSDALRRRAPKPVRAVDGVDLQIDGGQTLGLVGESGSGKTTLARVVIGLDSRTGGGLELLGADIHGDLHSRGIDLLSQVSMVFQNPQSSLNPYMSIRQILRRPLVRLRGLSADAADDEVRQLLERVNLRADYAERYPDELSGGEKQRVAIARAFASQPRLVICDEPVSALDVSVQAAVLNLLADLQEQQGSACLFISHNLSVVGYLADVIAVMYLGQIVEIATADSLFDSPSHPYTEALLSAIPAPDPQRQSARVLLSDQLPSAQDLPGGCRFHTRCPRVIGDICKSEKPPWRKIDAGQGIRCHIPLDELATLQASPS